MGDRALRKSDLVKNWMLGYSSETCYNYERLQALGNANAFIPIIRRLYEPEQYAEEISKYFNFFNTEPSYMGTVIHGITAAMEEKRALDGDITADEIVSVRSALMGPLAGIGDVVSQSIVYPILAGVCIQLALAGNYAGPILFEIIYKAIMLTLGYNMYMLGYKQGKSAIISFLKTGVLNQILDLVSIVGLMVVGSMAVNNISYNLSLIGWEVQNEIGSVSFNLQTTVLDALLPGILPLGLVLGVRALLKKRVKPNTIILIMFVLAFVTVGLGALCGAYR
ncbi:PTS system mannose/fructose/sorbose family transporter subunit IID [Anaerosacchariphilus sp. NSJ-68]|uniref:PTS system mannose/fructose/sorbose family transporter subunit IID n=2 Tax=Lachnospiraceae TaxID=186803 RepID=A0A923LC89_9FIRM|nr:MULTISPECIES: PTS system mannose/fructose/sorbose family transporter subunit IID [Lachnospiraceae]MBC5659701.1 PTS system mannose/fructose/sorbose family transporter subunit IID [Anaerosacchariphilus hominis]MBC5697367.1 PTS system mannose/fructose/sorbose family transporter subunit IID [Roseburia difficilis]